MFAETGDERGRPVLRLAVSPRAGDCSLRVFLFFVVVFFAVSVVRSPHCGLIKCLHCLRVNPFLAREAVFVVVFVVVLLDRFSS